MLKKEETIDAADLPEKITGAASPQFAMKTEAGEIEIPDKGLSFKRAVSDYESSLIMGALKKTGGNKNKAASLLRLNRTTLVEKIKKKGMEQGESE